MYTRFLGFIKENSLLQENDKVLLAVSAGVDSMVMAHLFSRLGITFAMAHCNFRLRPGDAEKEQLLARNTASALKVRFFTTDFNTEEYSKQKSVSIQVAARNLRYEWLEEIRQKHGYNLIATAHHLDDSIETLLINISRGTGIHGLKGIPVRNEKVIRPLLFVTRKQIEEYAEENNIEFLHDLSNFDDKYLRNKIRLNILPLLRQLNPSFHQSMQGFFEKMKDTEEVFNHEIEKAKKLCIKPVGTRWLIDIQELKKLSPPGIYLYEFLNPSGFSATSCNDIVANLDSQPGKRFYSADYGLVKDRDFLIVYPRNEENYQDFAFVKQDTQSLDLNDRHFTFSQFQLEKDLRWPENENTVFLDYEKLQFPLLLRPWQDGDRIAPLGINGSRKVSDVLTDKKLSLPEKSRVMVLVSGENIVWIAGVKPSNRFKITNNTRIVFSAHVE